MGKKRLVLEAIKNTRNSPNQKKMADIDFTIKHCGLIFL